MGRRKLHRKTPKGEYLSEHGCEETTGGQGKKPRGRSTHTHKPGMLHGSVT